MSNRVLQPNFTEDEYGDNYHSHILEMYKLYVQMADNISKRRMDTNNFFISVNTFLFGALVIFKDWDKSTLTLVALVGIVLAVSWFYLLKSYRSLNSGKFKVVHEIESMLPISPYDVEWIKLGKGRNKDKYWPLSHIEVVLPILVGIIYVIMLVYTLFFNSAAPIPPTS